MCVVAIFRGFFSFLPVIFIAGMITIMLGCSQEPQPISDCSQGSQHPTKPGVYINKRVIGIDALRMTDPILYVNGEKVTKRDFEALLILRDKLWRICQNRTLDVTPGEIDKFRVEAGDGLMLELIHQTLFRQYAKKINATPSQKQIDIATKDLLKSLRRPGYTIEGIATLIGGDAAELFRKIPYFDARDAISRQSVTTNDLDNVSDDELQRRIDFVKRFDANAEAMNEKAKERLKAARKRIMAGADIAEEASKIFDTVHPEYAKKWGRFEIQEFPADEDLHKWLLTAKVGDISDPLDLDDGIAIVKVLEKGKGEAPEGVTPPDAYTLVRCTVKALEKMRYQDERQMRNQLLFWKRQEAQKKLGVMLAEEAVIEYPNGTNLFTNLVKEDK